MTAGVAEEHVGLRTAAAWSATAVTGALLAGVLRLDQLIGRAGVAAAPRVGVAGVPLMAAAASSSVVGAVLVSRRGHVVGWALLAVGFFVALSGVLDGYASYALLARPGALAGGPAAEAVANASFVPWLTAVGFVLLLTPTGRPPTPRWGVCAWILALDAPVWLFSKLANGRTFDPPYTHIANPLTIRALASFLQVTEGVAAILTDLGLVAAAVSLVVRYRRANDDERAPLRWVAGAAAGIALLPLAASAGALTHHPSLTAWASGFYVAVFPVATWAAISRYRLYDVGRIVNRTLLYLALTGVVAATYTVVVVALSEPLAGFAAGSKLAVAAATLAAAAVFNPARRWLQERLDRRFNRRRWAAVRTVETFLRRPPTVAAGETVEAVLARALDDPDLRVVYWLDDEQRHVDAAGREAEAPARGVPVERDGALVARVTLGPACDADAATVRRVLETAAPELESARLRAAVEVQLVEVRQSRARLVEAADAARRRIERNLHDGAQQRLVALTLQLRASQLQHAGNGMGDVLNRAVSELQGSLQDLRDLANGLHPAVLTDEGLVAALEDLAGRAALPVALDVTVPRLPPPVEAAAYFIACEAVANAAKHADAVRVALGARVEAGVLRLEVRDDGVGGADLDGAGLVGLRDRAAAVGGVLHVESPPGQGTIVTAELPCEW